MLGLSRVEVFEEVGEFGAGEHLSESSLVLGALRVLIGRALFGGGLFADFGRSLGVVGVKREGCSAVGLVVGWLESTAGGLLMHVLGDWGSLGQPLQFQLGDVGEHGVPHEPVEVDDVDHPLLPDLVPSDRQQQSLQPILEELFPLIIEEVLQELLPIQTQ